MLLYVLSALAAPLIAWRWGPDAAYWATPARASEIVAGALLAVWWSARSTTTDTPHGARRFGWLGVACLVVLGVACVTFPAGSGLAYRGALPLVGILSAGLILGLQAPGPLRRVLSARPLVAVGLVSYGLYLYHWPVFVLVDRQRWALPFWVLLAIKVAITAAVTVASYVLIERPIRRAGRLPARRTLSLGLAATALVAALVVVVPQPGRFYAVNTAAARAAAIDAAPVAPLVAPPTVVTLAAPDGLTPSAASTVATTMPTEPMPPPATMSTEPSPTDLMPSTALAGASSTDAPTTTVAVVPPRPVRILVAGDSTAEATGNGLIAWAVEHPELAQVSLAVQEGCGFVPGGYIEAIGVVDRDVDKNCRHYLHDVLPARVRRLRPDVVVMMTTSWDVFDRKLHSRSDPVLPVTDPQVSSVVRTAMTEVTDEMLGLGAARVVWLREPIPDPFWQQQKVSQTDPAAHQVLYDAMAEIAAADPAARVVDLAGFADESGLAADYAARPDGTHWAPAAATQIATAFLGPAIVRASLT